jgi:hypothetical protein
MLPSVQTHHGACGLAMTAMDSVVKLGWWVCMISAKVLRELVFPATTSDPFAPLFLRRLAVELKRPSPSSRSHSLLPSRLQRLPMAQDPPRNQPPPRLQQQELPLEHLLSQRSHLPHRQAEIRRRRPPHHRRLPKHQMVPIKWAWD